MVAIANSRALSNQCMSSTDEAEECHGGLTGSLCTVDTRITFTTDTPMLIITATKRTVTHHAVGKGTRGVDQSVVKGVQAVAGVELMTAIVDGAEVAVAIRRTISYDKQE